MGGQDPFNRIERILSLGVGLGIGWSTLWVKYKVHKSNKVHELEDKVENPHARKALDIAICSGAATLLNTIAGANMVKKVMRNDWDSQGGCKGVLATFAEAWGAIFTFA